VDLAAGYTQRVTRPGDLADCERLAALLNAGFGRTIHTAREYLAFTRGSPSFQHDLNLVAEAPDGSLAAHVGLTLEPVNGYAVFEPVVTHPDHRRHGLARSLMHAGLRLLQARGAREAYVGTGDAAAANALYDAIGFTEAYRGHLYQKTVVSP
jgi:predicted N-acetyltransferase YhbS